MAGGSGAVIAIVAAVVVIGGGLLLLRSRRRRDAEPLELEEYRGHAELRDEDERTVACRQGRGGAADARLRPRLQLLPLRVMGDPTTQLARLPNSTPEEIEKLRDDYGHRQADPGQFADYAGDTARLDLGISQRSRESVWDEIKKARPWTLLLVGTGTLLATLIGSWLGVVAATRRGKKTDPACSASACSPTPRPSTGSGSS